jgi:hypothetical protein
MEDLTFASYLKSKKIDSKAFYNGQKETFESWKREFDQMHPNSFTQQKLFLINSIRREYPLVEKAETGEVKKPAMRPKINKPKTT